MDFCKAIAAAMFDGQVNVNYVEVSSSEDGFRRLNSGAIDILSGVSITLERDVQEATTGSGFSFTQPVFYSGLAFGGIPE